MKKLEKDLAFLLIVKALEQKNRDEANDMLKIVIRSISEDKKKMRVAPYIRLENQEEEKTFSKYEGEADPKEVVFYYEQANKNCIVDKKTITGGYQPKGSSCVTIKPPKGGTSQQDN